MTAATAILWRGRCGDCGRLVLINGPRGWLPKHQAKGGDYCGQAASPPAMVTPTAASKPSGRLSKVKSAPKATKKLRDKTAGTKPAAQNDNPTARRAKTRARTWDGFPSSSVCTVCGGLPGPGKRR